MPNCSELDYFLMIYLLRKQASTLAATDIFWISAIPFFVIDFIHLDDQACQIRCLI